MDDCNGANRLEMKKSKTHRILLVDDSISIRDFCRMSLEKEGYQVIIAGDGQEALVAAYQYTPDVIIMDIQMPGMDGLETVRNIRLSGSKAPIILHTAFSASFETDDRMGGANACVEKSGDLSVLKTTISRMLARSGRVDGDWGEQPSSL